MTLYRIDYTGDTKLNRYTEMLIDNGQLIEVEPCLHGNYAAHIDEDNITVLSHERHTVVWCPGAGIGDTE